MTWIHLPVTLSNSGFWLVRRSRLLICRRTGGLHRALSGWHDNKSSFPDEEIEEAEDGMMTVRVQAETGTSFAEIIRELKHNLYIRKSKFCGASGIKHMGTCCERKTISFSGLTVTSSHHPVVDVFPPQVTDSYQLADLDRSLIHK